MKSNDNKNENKFICDLFLYANDELQILLLLECERNTYYNKYISYIILNKTYLSSFCICKQMRIMKNR